MTMPMSVIITSSPPLTSFVRHPDLFKALQYRGSTELQYRAQSTPELQYRAQSTCQRSSPPSLQSTGTIPSTRGDCAPISSVGMYHWKSDAMTSSIMTSRMTSHPLSELSMDFGKSVRFADAIGLPLTQVKMLYKEDELEETLHSALIGSTPSPTPQPGLVLNFQQPRARLDLLPHVRQQHVSLENVVVTNNDVMATILVHNISFAKSVCLRLSKDYWITHTDYQCTYSGSVSKDIDRLMVKFSVEHTFPVGARLELCVQYCVGEEQWWDSNGGVNYQIECRDMGNEVGQRKGLTERNDLLRGVAPYLNLKPPPSRGPTIEDVRALFTTLPYY